MASSQAQAQAEAEAELKQLQQKQQTDNKSTSKGKASATINAKELFRKLDFDRNNFLSSADIRESLKAAGIYASDREIDLMIKMGDQEGAGQMRFEDFSSLLVQIQKAMNKT